jgi:multidrug resistance efflux pump
MKTAIARLFALVLVLACAACSKGKSAPATTPPPTVQTFTATVGTLNSRELLSGLVAPYQQIGVTSDLSEPIVEVDVREGQAVKAGQVLARLETDDLDAQLASAERTVSEDVARYRQQVYEVGATTGSDVATINAARASLRQAQATYAGALRDFRRYAALEQQGFLSPETLDQQRTTVVADEEAVNAAQASLNSAISNARANGSYGTQGEQQQEIAAAKASADAAEASTEQLRREIARAVIVAPADGVVDSVNANPGEYPASRELFTIERVGYVYAELLASDAQLTGLQRGAGATVKLPGSTATYHGTVDGILDEVEPGTTNFMVRVLVKNDSNVFHSGASIVGQVDLAPVRGVIVPDTAYVDDTKSSVYVVRNGVVQEQGNILVVSDDGVHSVVTGLAPGTAVIQDFENANVGIGDHVKIKNA